MLQNAALEIFLCTQKRTHCPNSDTPAFVNVSNYQMNSFLVRFL